MSDMTTSGVRQSGVKLTLQYLAFLIGGILFLWLLLWAAEEFLGVTPSSNAMGIVLPLVAAMAVAGLWYKKEGARPASGRAWGMALVWGVVTVALQLLLVYAAWKAGALAELIGSNGPTDEDRQMFAIVFAVLGVVQVLVLRLGLWLGFRGTAKQLEREAAKRAKAF
ncbi:hypothetical protein MASR1M32_39930 [Rhodobacter sp.]